MLLKDLFDFLPKSSRPASYGRKEGKYPFFTSSNTIDSFVDVADFDGEFLIIGDGGTGNCKYYNGPFSASDHNFILKPKAGTNSIAVRYFLMKNHYEILNKGFKGVGIKNVSKTYIENIDYKKNSSLPEAEIVQILSEIENKIEHANYKLLSYDELVKSRFIEMFKTIDLSEQKDDWVEIESKSRIITGTTPSTNDESNWGGNILWITPAEMTKETFYVYDTTRKLTENGRKSKSLELMPEGTVLLSTRAPIGKVGIVGKPMACNQGFKNFICDSSVNPIFLYVLLKNNTDYLNSLGSGTTFLEISKTKIGKMKIPVPEIKKQIEFAEFVKLIDKSKFIVRKEIELLQELLDSKMNEYFSDN